MECILGLLFIECLLPCRTGEPAAGNIENYVDDGLIKKNGSVENIYNNNVLGGFAPATAAAPIAISVENRFSIALFYQCGIRNFPRQKK